MDDISVLKCMLLPYAKVEEGDEVWDHSSLLEDVLNEISELKLD